MRGGRIFLKTKGAVRALRALLPYCKWAITVRDGALALKGSHSMGGGRIFLKTRRDVSFKGAQVWDIRLRIFCTNQTYMDMWLRN
jgi:hypothetical protein